MAERAQSKLGVVLGVGVLLGIALLVPPARAEDGYDLWLRYRPLAAEQRERLTAIATRILIPPRASATVRAAAAELEAGVSGLAARPVSVTQTLADGSLVFVDDDDLVSID